MVSVASSDTTGSVMIGSGNAAGSTGGVVFVTVGSGNSGASGSLALLAGTQSANTGGMV